MNVLSLFDGCSGGQQALERAGIKYNKYYASEIDKYAIQVTQHNYPDTIQLGNVVDVDVTKLEPIDLLIGGSPCQSFSFAGKRNGMTTSCNEEIYTLERYLELKADGFQFEGESYLFWEYMRILTDIRKYNPDVLFLLENVEMGAKWEKVLSEAIGIYGVHINSALVSAQNRKRIYWTNIRVKEVGLFGELHSDIPQPEDRGILLKDILEDEVDEKYYLSDKMLGWLDKHSEKRGVEVKKLDGEQKAGCLTATAQVKQNLSTDYVCVAMRGRGENNEQTLEPQPSGKSNSLTSVQKDNLVMQLKQINDRVDDVSFNEEGIRPHRNDAKKSGIQELGTIGMENTKSSCVTSVHSPKILVPEATAKGYERTEIKSGTWRTHEDGRGFREIKSGKAACVPARAREDGSGQNVAQIGTRIRRLTPVECERLQTVEDNFTACVSDTQRYKILGNGWTIDVIAHIFRYIT
jgi:DNA-cytosine methyltransferase